MQSTKVEQQLTMPWHTARHVDMGWACPEGLDLEKNIAFQHAAALTGVSIKRKGHTWKAVIQGEIRGRPVVAFVASDTYRKVLDLLLYACDQGQLTWYDDRYPNK